MRQRNQVGRISGAAVGLIVAAWLLTHESACDQLPCIFSATCAKTIPTPRKIVIVIEENHAHSRIIGNADAPYINRLATEGALFTQSYAVTHPSQPNYIALFSGSTQGVINNSAWPHEVFTAPNLGSKLLAAGRTFVGYSDGLPEVGSDVENAGNETDGYYRRKHNPWVNWQDATVPTPPNKLPPSVNRPFTDFPTDFSQLPDLCIVVPNQKHDMHDGTVAEGDAWLERNLGPYIEWAKTNDSLFILTFDEDDGLEFNRIPTVFVGPMVVPGQYNVAINHYNVLRTLEAMHGLGRDGATLIAAPIAGTMWRTSP